MKKLRRRYLSVLFLVACVCLKSAAADTPRKVAENSYKVSVQSEVKVETAAGKRTTENNAVLCYTWIQKGNEKLLRFDSEASKWREDGIETMNMFQSLKKVVIVRGGKEKELDLTKSPDSITTPLKEMFGGPSYRIVVDDNNVILKRELITGPNGKALAGKSSISSALYFHAPFLPAETAWDADFRVSVDQDPLVKSTVNYKKGPVTEGLTPVIVSGTISREENVRVALKKGVAKTSCVVSGKQNYDTVQNDWVSGELTLQESNEVVLDGSIVNSSAWQFKAVFEKLARKN